MFSDSCRSWAAIINVTEPSGVHLIKSVMVVLTVKSNEVILNIVDLRLEWECSKTCLMPFFAWTIVKDKSTKVGTLGNVVFYFESNFYYCWFKQTPKSYYSKPVCSQHTQGNFILWRIKNKLNSLGVHVRSEKKSFYKTCHNWTFSHEMKIGKWIWLMQRRVEMSAHMMLRGEEKKMIMRNLSEGFRWRNFSKQQDKGQSKR